MFTPILSDARAIYNWYLQNIAVSPNIDQEVANLLCLTAANVFTYSRTDLQQRHNMHRAGVSIVGTSYVQNTRPDLNPWDPVQLPLFLRNSETELIHKQLIEFINNLAEGLGWDKSEPWTAYIIEYLAYLREDMGEYEMNVCNWINV